MINGWLNQHSIVWNRKETAFSFTVSERPSLKKQCLTLYSPRRIGELKLQWLRFCCGHKYRIHWISCRFFKNYFPAHQGIKTARKTSPSPLRRPSPTHVHPAPLCGGSAVPLLSPQVPSSGGDLRRLEAGGGREGNKFRTDKIHLENGASQHHERKTDV